jgi:hypothetical protein
MGHWAAVRPVLLSNYQFMAARNVASEALYNLTLLAENALNSGDFVDASAWLTKAASIVANDERATEYSLVAYFVAAATLALYEARPHDAEALLAQAQGRYPVLTAPRVRAVHLSLLLRIQASRGQSAVNQEHRSELARLYEQGGHLGGNDGVVEALWRTEVLCGSRHAASELLRRYLLEKRRETTPHDWSLRTTTAADPAWGDVSSPNLARAASGEDSTTSQQVIAAASSPDPSAGRDSARNHTREAGP